MRRSVRKFARYSSQGRRSAGACTACNTDSVRCTRRGNGKELALDETVALDQLAHERAPPPGVQHSGLLRSRGGINARKATKKRFT